jgi:pimeloyl-ACP methyl ester carboxylesterase
VTPPGNSGVVVGAERDDETSEVRTRRVRGAGLEVAVTERGDRTDPTIVLVHGYPDNQVVWDPIAEALSVEFHVVTYDVRGAGATDVPDGVDGYTLSLLTRDFLAVIDAVAPGESVHLVGHDWGSIQGWEFVGSPRTAGRIASFTSISGPSLDHVNRWMRRRVTPKPSIAEVVRQGGKSWYVAAMRVPGLVEWAWRRGLAKRWPSMLERSEGVSCDSTWPGSTLAADGANGAGLYRTNILRRSARPEPRGVDVPVQVVVPRGDSYVSPALVRGIESMGPRIVRREVDGGHWIIRQSPERVVEWIVEHIAEHPLSSG